MYRYTLYIYDIANIDKPVLLKELPLDAASKEDAQDKGHETAYRLFPEKKRMIETRAN